MDSYMATIFCAGVAKPCPMPSDYVFASPTMKGT